MLRRAAGLRLLLGAVWAAERQRVFLWVPVLFGAGSGLYLTLPDEPVGWIAPVAAGLFAVAALVLRRHTLPALGLAALALFAAGVAPPTGARTGSARRSSPSPSARSMSPAAWSGSAPATARSATSWIV